MAQHFYLAGVELDPDRVRLDSDRPLVQAASLTVSGAGIQLEDPDGDLVFNGWKTFMVTEDDCAEQVTWVGYMGQRTIRRGTSDKTGAARTITCDLYDLNAIMGFRVLHTASAKRPQETEAARITWLLGSEAMDGIVFDNGYVSTNAQVFDEADFRGQYALDVLASLGSSAKQAYVFWDSSAASGEEVTLWYNPPSVANRVSTLAISNVLSDVDDVTTFAPMIDAELVRRPEETYSGVYLTYANGELYTESATTAANFVARDGRYDSSRIGRASTAAGTAANYLVAQGQEFDEITCTVRLPSDKVNLLLAGMQLDVRFSHLPGYETATAARVEQRTVRPTARWDAYDLDLVLSVAPIGGTVGGPPGGEFPGGGPNCTIGTTDLAAGIVPTQWGTFYAPNGTAANVTDGSDLTGDATQGGTTGGVTTEDGWDLDLGSAYTLGRMRWYWSSAFSLTPPASGTTAYTWTTSEVQYVLRLYYSDDGSSWTESDYSFTNQELSGKHDFSMTPVVTTAHRYWRFAEWLTSPGGVHVKFATSLFAWEFYEITCTTAPPGPNQPVNNEVPSGTVDGTNDDFTTAHPFADGTLVVMVDGIDQTDEVTTYDGATGAFTLSFPPLSDEEIRVWYRGR